MLDRTVIKEFLDCKVRDYEILEDISGDALV